MDLGGFRVLPQRFNSSLFSRRITSRLRNVRKSLESRSGTRVGGLQSESFGNVLARTEVPRCVVDHLISFLGTKFAF